MTEIAFRGVYTRPRHPICDGAVDEAAMARLIERQIASGVHGLVPVGTTGETATLSHAEHRRVVSLTVEVAAGRVPVIAGAAEFNGRSDRAGAPCPRPGPTRPWW